MALEMALFAMLRGGAGGGIGPWCAGDTGEEKGMLLSSSFASSNFFDGRAGQVARMMFRPARALEPLPPELSVLRHINDRLSLETLFFELFCFWHPERCRVSKTPLRLCIVASSNVSDPYISRLSSAHCTCRCSSPSKRSRTSPPLSSVLASTYSDQEAPFLFPCYTYRTDINSFHAHLLSTACAWPGALHQLADQQLGTSKAPRIAAAAHALPPLILAPSALHQRYTTSSHSPPRYRTTTAPSSSAIPPTLSSPPNRHPAQPDHPPSVLHPRVAVLLGVEKHWHLPLLLCRALSTAPAVWWGLRCALTFLGELLLVESIGAGHEGGGGGGGGGAQGRWSVEKRFRVTEVFLALLWVWMSSFLTGRVGKSEAWGQEWGGCVERVARAGAGKGAWVLIQRETGARREKDKLMPHSAVHRHGLVSTSPTA